ncbi:Electron transfer flavoprotein small subunit [Anaerohalosphaera lusitana]|uniref:Electron transfer flavoprotein small subunit n=1 Tax=Anaerohalosphaera lusitana TaxID=1936003 RepID=A0A1U9NLT6_9BACT|nr:electron transfer flavoprotein subunit beta/FixA family protein [Anaerohalosphaera lusitana]AQT68540.1 Electron transfer flavoprotein small subunit [Anaerohalosphaera lusitana]
MAYNCVVLVKQVPDTTRITGEAMNPDGTVNRGALPAIFNPEDLNALELALDIKDKFGGKVTAITMGLPTASTVLKEALYRGADEAILVTDRRCAASDTLATSYILSCAVKKLDPDIILCGRQAIDGDTAQVGPQLAEKLGVAQITYVEKLLQLEEDRIAAKRSFGNGWQEVRGKLPVLLTVVEEANEPRVNVAHRMMKYKNAMSKADVEKQIRAENPDMDDEAFNNAVNAEVTKLENKGILIKQWDLDFLAADLQWCGRDGSPTKVHRIQSVVLAAKGAKDVEATDQGITDMVHELIEDNTIA